MQRGLRGHRGKNSLINRFAQTAPSSPATPVDLASWVAENRSSSPSLAHEIVPTHMAEPRVRPLSPDAITVLLNSLNSFPACDTTCVLGVEQLGVRILLPVPEIS